MNILGLSAWYHDSAACLVRDGEIIAAAQEERFTRKKHDPAYPRHSIEYCLRTSGITARDLDAVAFYEKPFLKFDRLLHSYLATAPFGLASFLKAIPVWIREKIWIKDTLRRELAFDGPVLFPEHHESHAASAFFPSPFREAAILTVDGVGEWTTTSWGAGRGNTLDLRAEMRFPHSLGLLYSAFTYFCGFKVNSGEYKLMGLAPFGTPKYRDLILRELLDLKPDGSFRLNLRCFDFISGLRMTNARFAKLFNRPPRRPESPLTQDDMDIARSIQDVTDEILLRLARHVRRETGLRNLCLAGGVALNCVANGRILADHIFDRVRVQPAAGDAGGALGAALAVWHRHFGKPREADDVHDRQRGSLLGPEFSDGEIAATLRTAGLEFRELGEAELAETVADLIAAGNIVGWFQGRMEFGPRALGARSILGDARSATMQETMNLKIKFRESFRPFAPAVLEERAAELFDLRGLSPYMLVVAPVRGAEPSPAAAAKSDAVLARLRAARSPLPAVTHVDGSARVQTVGASANPRFRALLEIMARRHGCPAVVNTSFNVRGEPIVGTPQDAIRCFQLTNMDWLAIGNCLVKKTAQLPLEQTRDWLGRFELD